ncbi:hypothetical protein [Streptomyces lydicus]
MTTFEIAEEFDLGLNIEVVSSESVAAQTAQKTSASFTCPNTYYASICHC